MGEKTGIAEERTPDYIVPFQISAEEALLEIRANMKFVMGVSAAGKSIKLEDLQGVFIPYWDYDVQCHIRADIKKMSSSSYSGVTNCYREAECRLPHVLQNASVTLSDDFVRKLEPYDMKETVAFENRYLEGYFTEELSNLQRPSEDKICSYLNAILSEEVKWSVGDPAVQNISMDKFESQYFWNGAPRLTLLPVWFLKLSYKKKVYSIMVNGQTGKVIGTIPVFGWVYAYQTIKYGLIFSAAFCLLFFFLYDLSGGLPQVLTWSLLICSPLFVMSGIRNIVNKNKALKKLQTTEELHLIKEGKVE